MKKVGIVSCDKWAGKITEDLLLREELLSCNIDADIISWEDKTIDYEKYDALVLRSVWGYQNKYQEFKDWLGFLKERNIAIYNPSDLILNNIQKEKQFKLLQNNNMPIIDTSFAHSEEDAKSVLENTNISVIKPIVSGSGERTFLLDGMTYQEKMEIIKSYTDLYEQNDNGIMMQPFVSGVKSGEYACVFIDGVNTHNIIRYPGIFADKKKPVFIKNVPGEVMDLANQVASIKEYKDCLYMRVDIVLDGEKPVLMEVELAEPDLYFKRIDDEEVKKEGLSRLSRGIVRRIR